MAVYIRSFLSDKMENLSYLIIDEDSKNVVIVDPTFNVDSLLLFISGNHYTIHSIWLTHTHYDHISGLDAVLDVKNNCHIYVHKNGYASLNGYSNIFCLEDGETILFGSLEWVIYHTPGHSSDGICFHSHPYLITGDTLFIDRCGRADITGANVHHLYASLERLKKLPPDTIIYPGHDYGHSQFDTIESQLIKNPYLRVGNENEFIRLRMGK